MPVLHARIIPTLQRGFSFFFKVGFELHVTIASLLSQRTQSRGSSDWNYRSHLVIRTHLTGIMSFVASARWKAHGLSRLDPDQRPVPRPAAVIAREPTSPERAPFPHRPLEIQFALVRGRVRGRMALTTAGRPRNEARVGRIGAHWKRGKAPRKKWEGGFGGMACCGPCTWMWGAPGRG